jgi:acyl dehydratase
VASTETDEPERRFALITDDALEALRRLIGVRIVDTVEPWCYEATRDNIRHYAHGIGDDNPLWCDPGYAASTAHGDVIAPPSFVFALDRVLSGYVGGLPGIHAMWSGADLTWERPMARGDSFRAEAWLADLVEHDTRFAGRAVQQIYEVHLRNQRDETVCTGTSWCFRTERDTARELGTKYVEPTAPPPPYDDAMLHEIATAYEQEVVRGAERRWFEDVAVGDELGPLTKGPMTITGFIAFAQGWGGLYIRANRLAWKQLRRHPAIGIPNRFGVPDVPERVHWDEALARQVGTPGAYDYGPERASWLMQQVTDWMGDDGFLVRHRSQIRRHNAEGDRLAITARVTATRRGPDGAGLVEVSQEARTQHGELSATADATVRVPRRAR